MSPIWEQLSALFIAHQGEIVAVVSAFLFAALSRKSPWFAGLGDWTKRAILFVVAVGVSALVSALGSTPNIDLGAILIAGGFSAGAAGSVAKAANNTPSTEAESVKMAEDKKMGTDGATVVQVIGAVVFIVLILGSVAIALSSLLPL